MRERRRVGDQIGRHEVRGNRDQKRRQRAKGGGKRERERERVHEIEKEGGKREG